MSGPSEWGEVCALMSHAPCIMYVYMLMCMTISQYNGAAPDAKIVFDDVGGGSGGVDGIPDDLHTGLFPHSYEIGARVYSISWGNTANFYDLMASEIDEFTYQHQDFLVLVAVGNDGSEKSTVGSPATAKNILAVGATHNAEPQRGLLVVMRVLPTVWGMELRVEATPANFGAQIDSITHVELSLEMAFPLHACSKILKMPGRIALVQRDGLCTFHQKVLNAQNAGAYAVVVFNHVDESPVVMYDGDAEESITIPAIFVSMQDGSALVTAAVLASEKGVPLTVELAQRTPLSPHHSIASFSSRGPTDKDFRTKPDVLCPGTNIYSASSDGITGKFSTTSTYTSHDTANTYTHVHVHTHTDSNNCGVRMSSGTSFAAPLCAGTAALVREYFERGFAASGVENSSHTMHPSSALVKAVMIHSAQPVKSESVSGAMVYSTTYPNPHTGYGRVELNSALAFADSPFAAVYSDNSSLATGGHAMFCFNVQAIRGREFRVSLVWTDAPGNPVSVRALVNDLDLVVTDPNNIVYLGNNITQTDESHGVYAMPDSVNNAEQVRITSGGIGLYAVSVIGTDIAQGPQKFALVASASSIEHAPAARCLGALCPNTCSGRGECVGSGTCVCPLSHGGVDCSRAHTIIPFSTALTPTVTLSVSWMGMSYYIFHIPTHASFTLSIRPGAHRANNDADFYLAKSKLPTVLDFDEDVTDRHSTADFTGGAGTWVLGLFAYEGDVSVLVSLYQHTNNTNQKLPIGGSDGGSDNANVLHENLSPEVMKTDPKSTASTVVQSDTQKDSQILVDSAPVARDHVTTMGTWGIVIYVAVATAICVILAGLSVVCCHSRHVQRTSHETTLL